MDETLDQPISFRVEQRDVVEAMQAVFRRRLFRGIGAIMLAVLVALWLVLAVLTLHLGQSMRDVILLAVAVPMLLALLQYGFVPLLARRHYRQSRALQMPLRFWVEGDVVHLEGERGQSAIPMAEFWRWGETKRLLLLFHSEMAYNIVPRELLGDGRTQALVAALEAAGVRRS